MPPFFSNCAYFVHFWKNLLFALKSVLLVQIGREKVQNAPKHLPDILKIFWGGQKFLWETDKLVETDKLFKNGQKTEIRNRWAQNQQMMIYIKIAQKWVFWCLNISVDTILDLYRPYRPIENFDENCQKWHFFGNFWKKYTKKQEGIFFTKMKFLKIFDHFHQNF